MTITMEDMMREVHTKDAQSTLNNMVCTLAETFQLEFVYIAQANEQLTEATTLAIVAETSLIENVSYDLTISPCLEIYEKEEVIVYDGDLKKPYTHNPFIMTDWDVDSYVGVPLWDVSGHFLGHFAACKRGKLQNNELLVAFIRKYSSWAALQIERINKERDLERVSREKDRLLSIISHDLRGPIGGLEMMLEMFLDEQIEQKDFRAMAVDAKRSISGLRNNMETLLEWTYRQSREVKAIFENFSIAKEVQSVLDFLLGMASQKGIVLTHNIPPHLQTYADRQQINLVLRNLITNAIKFTPSGGQIQASSTLKDDKIIVTVEDNGIGISAARIPTIFEDHDTVHGTNGEKGTGLGLSLCKEIIAQHAEKIWVESEVGKGSTFFFSLSAKKITPTDKLHLDK